MSVFRVGAARSVRISVPSYTGAPTEIMQRSLADGLMALKGADIHVEEVDILQGCCYLDHSRNVLTDRFLRGKASDMIFLDADVGFEGASLLRLCEATRPLVAGIYPKKTATPEYPVQLPAGEIWADDDGLVECLMVPTGFMRIHRSVFDALTVERYAHLDGMIGAYFQCVVRDGTYWGEDVEFCRRVRDAGIPIHAIAEMDFEHVAIYETGQTIYRGNWGRHLLSQLKEAA